MIMKVCIANQKGGVGKTKTAVHLALGLSRSGRTLLVDADPNQAAAYEWAGTAGEHWPSESCVVVQESSRELVRRVRPMMADYQHVVFDVGPKNPVLMRQAMSLSDGVVVPARPTTDELRELPKTFEVAAEVDAIHPLWVAVLLVQVRPGTTSEQDARELLTSFDMPAFEAQVRLLKRYEQSFGTVPLDDLGDYEAVLSELLQVEERAEVTA
jgi:chromosome partitioning protein